MTGPTDEAEVTRGDRFIKTAVEILRRNRTHRLHRARGRRALQDLAARLLPAFQQQGRTAARAVRQDHRAVGACLARRDHRPGQHLRAEAGDRPHQPTTRIEHPGQPQPGAESLQPASGRDPSPRIRPRAVPVASTDSRHRRPGHHRGRVQPGTRCRGRGRDRHADHGGCAAIALAGKRIERNADRRRPAVRLLQPRAGHPRHRRGIGHAHRWRSYSPRSACARAPTMANSR